MATLTSSRVPGFSNPPLSKPRDSMGDHQLSSPTRGTTVHQQHQLQPVGDSSTLDPLKLLSAAPDSGIGLGTMCDHRNGHDECDQPPQALSGLSPTQRSAGDNRIRHEPYLWNAFLGCCNNSDSISRTYDDGMMMMVTQPGLLHPSASLPVVQVGWAPPISVKLGFPVADTSITVKVGTSSRPNPTPTCEQQVHDLKAARAAKTLPPTMPRRVKVVPCSPAVKPDMSLQQQDEVAAGESSEAASLPAGDGQGQVVAAVAPAAAEERLSDQPPMALGRGPVACDCADELDFMERIHAGGHQRTAIHEAMMEAGATVYRFSRGTVVKGTFRTMKHRCMTAASKAVHLSHLPHCWHPAELFACFNKVVTLDGGLALRQVKDQKNVMQAPCFWRGVYDDMAELLVAPEDVTRLIAFSGRLVVDHGGDVVYVLPVGRTWADVRSTAGGGDHDDSQRLTREELSANKLFAPGIESFK